MMWEIDAEHAADLSIGTVIPSTEESEFLELVNATMPPGLALTRTRCVSVSRQRRQVIMTCEFDDSFTSVGGFVCGGFLSHMLEEVATCASTLTCGKLSPSVEVSTNFVAPAVPGRYVAVGSVMHVGYTHAFISARLTDSASNLVATATVVSHLVLPHEVPSTSGGYRAS